MITFHPSISLGTLLKAAFMPARDAETRLAGLFPGHGITLTDSGRSALAVIIEALGLRRKRIAMPAYLCNNLLPVLRRYDITPVFVDIDTNFQPGGASYLGLFDAAIVVATYGHTPDAGIIASLKNRDIVVIEDYAHVPLPARPEREIAGTARYYSISKILPAPDGGIAVLPKDLPLPTLQKPPFLTLSLIKNLKKLLPSFTMILTALRFLIFGRREGHVPAWRGARAMHPLSRRFLSFALRKWAPQQPVAGFSYCYPLSVEAPDDVQKKLFKNGIIAERVWNDLIIDAARVSRQGFPNADAAAQRTICLPLWFLRTPEQIALYEQRLQQILPGEFAGFGKQEKRHELP